MQNDLTPKAI